MGGALRCCTLAAGGRYDGLLRALWPPPATAAWPAPCAVGATLNLDRLAAACITAAGVLLPVSGACVGGWGGWVGWGGWGGGKGTVVNRGGEA